MAKKRLIRGAGVALFGVLTLMSVTAVAQEVTRNRARQSGSESHD